MCAISNDVGCSIIVEVSVFGTVDHGENLFVPIIDDVLVQNLEGGELRCSVLYPRASTFLAG